MQDLMEPIEIEGFFIDPNQQQITRISDNYSLKISRSECLIVRLLANTPNQAVSREVLLEKCWTGKVVTSSSLNVAIKHIRSAFSSLGAEDIIVTEPKKGYLLRVQSGQQSITMSPIEDISLIAKLSHPHWFYNASPLLASRIKSALISHSVTLVFFVATLFTLSQYAFFVESTQIAGYPAYTDGFNLPTAVTDVIEQEADSDNTIVAFPLGGLCHQYQLFTYNSENITDLTGKIQQGNCNG